MTPNESMNLTDRIAEIRAWAELGLVANNGTMAMDPNATDFREDCCECDPEVGAVPCRYCAVEAALRQSKRTCAALDIAVEALEGMASLGKAFAHANEAKDALRQIQEALKP